MKNSKLVLDKHDYLYDTIMFWLSDEKYGNYLLTFINTLDETYLNDSLTYKNTKYSHNIRKNKNNKKFLKSTITELIMKKFVDSCRGQLINQKSNIVDKNYYVKLFNKIYNNPKYKHKDAASLNKMQKDLEEFVRSGSFKSEKKGEIIKALEQLTKKETEIKPLYEVDKKDLREHIRYFKDYLDSAIKDHSRMNFIEDQTIIIGRQADGLYQYAYSIDYKRDGSCLLRVHVLDINALMYTDTPLYFDMKNNNYLNEEIIDGFSMKPGKLSPTVTYQLNIDNRGCIYDFEFFKSLIKPKKIVDNRTSYADLKQDFEMKQYVYLYKILEHYYELNDRGNNLKDIDNALIGILDFTLGKYLKENELPSIYKVQDNPNSLELANQLINLNWIMYRLDDYDFRNVYNIICNQNNTIAHYSLNNIGHYGENKKCFLSTTKPFSFVGLKQQQTLFDFVGNYISSEEVKNRCQEELLDIVNYYNQKFYNISTPEVLDKKKTKVRKK